MRFEEQVTVLCARALAANDDDEEVRKILGDLRLVLHQHIEQLRSGLLVAYTKSMLRPESRRALQELDTRPSEDAAASQETREPSKTWQRVVHEIVQEKDYGRALQLSQELSRLLQHHAESPGQS